MLAWFPAQTRESCGHIGFEIPLGTRVETKEFIRESVGKHTVWNTQRAWTRLADTKQRKTKTEQKPEQKPERAGTCTTRTLRRSSTSAATTGARVSKWRSRHKESASETTYRRRPETCFGKPLETRPFFFFLFSSPSFLLFKNLIFSKN